MLSTILFIALIGCLIDGILPCCTSLVWPHSIFKDKEAQILVACIFLKNKDTPIPPEDVPCLTFNHVISSSRSTNQAPIQSGAHLAVSEDYNAMVKTIHRLMGFSRLQDQLVHPRLVPGFDELMERSIQRVVAAITGALENFTVNTPVRIWSHASDAMQERFLDMLAKAHFPRHHLVTDAAGAHGVIDDLEAIV